MKTLPTSSAALAKYFDHTLLRANATTAEIRQLCAEARQFNFCAVCVNPVYLNFVREELVGSGILAAVVVGFPLGATSIELKANETKWVVEHGAQEIDMVINIGAYLSGAKDECLRDINAVIKNAQGVPVKVIMETAYLNAEQIAELTKMSADAGAAFVKTSSGFAPRGASSDDIKIMAATLRQYGFNTVGIKASGGIKDWSTTKAMISAGATRIGSSSSVEILENCSTCLLPHKPHVIG